MRPLLIILALLLANAAADCDVLQDLCVADLTSELKINGYTCKNAATVTRNDFFFAALANPSPINNNTLGIAVTLGNVEKGPGFNTLGVSVARIDYAPGGINPPHSHPRASEVIFVLEGELEVGFITTANVLMAKQIKKGEVYVFPKGLLHYQKNIGVGPAAVIAASNSQLPGTQSVAASLFSATPSLPDNVLAKAFHIATPEAEKIKSRFAPK
ncbi:hypothetical protein SLEP1_g51680 [Rubroshorea leprosula]|uniref:Germin-like protein n=1 Tax=Rubroshorea leprosula TaxID=152421 RepID=A0AAV5M5H4_9ROSI|nr:hypothetical protein SLEP1_g51680 [Rubroshorea leprosula]